jgi:hypothetical protein
VEAVGRARVAPCLRRLIVAANRREALISDVLNELFGLGPLEQLLHVAMLAQTDRFGTSIAQALRTFADSSRTKRRQRAEERAAKLGVKLVFPLVFLLFPAMYVVTMGPAVIQFVRVFFAQVVSR